MNEFNIILYIGDEYKLQRIDAIKNNKSTFIDSASYEEYLELTNGNHIVHTSIGDLPKISKSQNILYDVINKAHKIVYLPYPEITNYGKYFDFSREDNANFDYKSMVEYILSYINDIKDNVEGLSKTNFCPYLHLVNGNRLHTRTLWVVGDNIVSGKGLIDKEDRFCELVSKDIAIPLRDISQGGISIEWAVDQIIRSDIKEGDIVIYGVTSEYRTPKWDCYENKAILDRRLYMRYNETRLYKGITSLYQLEKYCDLLGVTLILLPLLVTPTMIRFMQGLHSFCHITYRNDYIDYASNWEDPDLGGLVYPGIEQNKEWANICINRIHELEAG